MWAERAIIMDEPTAALGVIQTAKVLELVLRIRERGLAVVFVSHNLPQVLEIADRIEVMRLGARVARFRRGEADSRAVDRRHLGRVLERGAGMSEPELTQRHGGRSRRRSRGRRCRHDGRADADGPCQRLINSPVMVTFGAS